MCIYVYMYVYICIYVYIHMYVYILICNVKYIYYTSYSSYGWGAFALGAVIGFLWAVCKVKNRRTPVVVARATLPVTK